jgi:glycosyltransferase involved in cell wall biosynthesis
MLNVPDPQQIVEALRYAIQHPEEVTAIVDRGYQMLTTSFNWPTIAERTLALYQEVRMAQRNEEQERFSTAFEARFKRIFDLGFEGTVAVKVGDFRRGAELLCEAFDLNPDNPAIHEHLAIALKQRIIELRAELRAEPYDPARIAELQRYSETLRRVLYDPLDEIQAAAVTAVMPVFIRDNTKKAALEHLVEAVDSVLAQDFDRPIDLIMVDDRSEVDIDRFLLAQYPKHLSAILGEDGAVIHKASAGEGRRIQLIKKRTNSGNDVEPRNLAIWTALQQGGRYITHIDSDDRMPPDRVRASLAHMERERDADMVHGLHRCIDKLGNVVTDAGCDRWYSFLRRFVLGVDPDSPLSAGQSKRHNRAELERLTVDNWVHGGTVFYRSNVVLRIGLENMAPTVRYGADLVYWQKISHVAMIDFLPHILTEYRLHDGSMSQGAR